MGVRRNEAGGGERYKSVISWKECDGVRRGSRTEASGRGTRESLLCILDEVVNT